MALHPLHNCTDSTLPTKTNKTKRNEAKQNETKATRRFRQCVGIEARETASKTGHLAIHSAAQRSAAQRSAAQRSAAWLTSVDVPSTRPDVICTPAIRSLRVAAEHHHATYYVRDCYFPISVPSTSW
jgi:hypothetical protein